MGSGWDERCIVCHPEAKTPDSEDGFDHFCRDHRPPKEVAVDAMMGNDEALEEWWRETVRRLRDDGDPSGGM